jgi:hypothetical protein
VPLQQYIITVPDDSIITGISGGGASWTVPPEFGGSVAYLEISYGPNPGATFDVTVWIKCYNAGVHPVNMYGQVYLLANGGGLATLMAQVGAPAAVIDTWRAWPGGQEDHALNPIEELKSTDLGLDGEVDWDLRDGNVAAVISDGDEEKTHLQGKAAIRIRYDNKSPTAGRNDTVLIKATKGGATKETRRTVFKVSWVELKFTGTVLHDDNALSFEPETGANTRALAFNWLNEDDAERIAAKMEAILAFEPVGIPWSTRGVYWVYTQDPVGERGMQGAFELDREAIVTSVLRAQGVLASPRVRRDNYADWKTDGHSDRRDCQYPTDQRPNRAFRLDAPGLSGDIPVHLAIRGDLRESAKWHNGSEFQRISTWHTAQWHVDVTGDIAGDPVVLTQSGANGHGPGIPASNIPSARPIAFAGTAQTVAPNVRVQLAGSGIDTDNDQLVYAWAAPPGIQWLTETTREDAAFTAPAEPGEYTFTLTVTEDFIEGLYHHNPGGAITTSAPSTVIITVQP